MKQQFNKAAQGGFTLIELIVVIVILGILAATALPKFMDVGKDARAASINAAGGALKTASGMIHAKWLMNQVAGAVDMDGVSVTIDANGYAPATLAGNVFAAAGLSTTDYTPSVTGNVLTIVGANTPSTKQATCKVTYTYDTTATGTAPLIAVDNSDC